MEKTQCLQQDYTLPKFLTFSLSATYLIKNEGLKKFSKDANIFWPWSKEIFEKEKITLSTSSRVFPYFQGDSTIFQTGNFLKHIPDSKNL